MIDLMVHNIDGKSLDEQTSDGGRRIKLNRNDARSNYSGRENPKPVTNVTCHLGITMP